MDRKEPSPACHEWTEKNRPPRATLTRGWTERTVPPCQGWTEKNRPSVPVTVPARTPRTGLLAQAGVVTDRGQGGGHHARQDGSGRHAHDVSELAPHAHRGVDGAG